MGLIVNENLWSQFLIGLLRKEIKVLQSLEFRRSIWCTLFGKAEWLHSHFWRTFSSRKISRHPKQFWRNQNIAKNSRLKFQFFLCRGCNARPIRAYQTHSSNSSCSHKSGKVFEFQAFCDLPNNKNGCCKVFPRQFYARSHWWFGNFYHGFCGVRKRHLRWNSDITFITLKQDKP